jgi:hypothetical protein
MDGDQPAILENSQVRMTPDQVYRNKLQKMLRVAEAKRNRNIELSRSFRQSSQNSQIKDKPNSVMQTQRTPRNQNGLVHPGPSEAAES